MRRIIGTKDSGKTKKLMLECQQNNGIFVCQNPEHMRYKANVYGIHGLEIVGYLDFIDEIKEQKEELFPSVRPIIGYKNESKPIFVDEISGLVNFICLNRLSGYTLSED
jgi:hypothetical protein